MKRIEMSMRSSVVFLLVCVGLFSPVYCTDDTKAYLLIHPYDEVSNTLIVIYRTEKEDGSMVITKCDIIEQSGPIADFLKILPKHVELHLELSEYDALRTECKAFVPERQRRDSEYLDYYDYAESDHGDSSQKPAHAPHGAGINVLIFPGTKWCGNGDKARNFDDLGLHQDTDRCCRAHDMCNDTMSGGETKNNLTNSSPFTALNCQCDDEFYNCLDRINSLTSNTVGNSYFNILRRRCYALDYPKTKKCIKYRTFLKLICTKYDSDTKAEKVYQWFPAKMYKKIPFPGPLTPLLP